MSKRTNYANGDPITLACGCDGCNPSMVNGVLCHEHGCPDAWRDHAIKCFECGCDFYPESPGQRICNDHAPDPDDYIPDDDDDDDVDFGNHPDTFNINIDTVNGAFRDGNLATETARILREIAECIERGETTGRILDANGNTVGYFNFVK